MDIGFPFAIGSDGRTEVDATEAHVRAMIEQLLLTNPGERVNWPDFGGGLYQLVFASNSPELAATVQLTLQGAVQRYLADVVALQELIVTADNELLLAELNYVLRKTGALSSAQIELSPGGV